MLPTTERPFRGNSSDHNRRYRAALLGGWAGGRPAARAVPKLMTPATIPVPRNRPIYALAAALVIGAGLLWRSGRFPLPGFVAKYGGDALWALVVFLCLGIALPRRSTVGTALVAVGFAWSVEFLQLYHAPWIDGIRSTRLGRLVLGSTFNVPDLLAYAGGIALGAVAERVFLNKNQKA